MTSPQDYLLLKIHQNHGWGNPFNSDDFKDDPEILKTMTDLGMLPDRYWSKPEINFSDAPCTFQCSGESEYLPENIFDLLGEYRCEYPLKEGKITLFEDCIKGFGLLYYEKFGKESGYARQYCIDTIREIVIWHEFGHWITHWMVDKDGNRWDSENYFYDYGTKGIHEPLAQLFTYYAIINLDDLDKRSNYLTIFQFMLKRQAPCYHMHIDILKNKDFSWIGFFNALQKLRKETDIENVNLDTFIKHLMT